MYSYRRKSPKLAALLVAVTVAALLPAGAAAADPQDDKKRIDAEVAQAESILEGATERAQEAARQLVAANGAMPAAEELVVETKGEVVAAQVHAETARQRADEASAAVDAAEDRFAAADARLRAGQAEVAKMASAAYKGSGITNLNVLMGATAGDMIDRFGYVDRVVEGQQETVRTYLDALAEARREQNEATVAQAAADSAALDAEEALDEAAAAQQRAEDAAAEVADLVAQRESALRVAEEERSASLQKYEDAKAEAAKIEKALREWEAKKKAAAEQAKLQAGQLLIPVRGVKTSDFGNRFDPYYKVWQLHAGVDLAAPGGTPIHAAADGEVIMAGWNGGYGNYTCISHGRSGGKALSTCYGHQSQILVHAGQRVRRGQTIGRVGTTGASTGNHVHFEVRLNGTPVQPLTWLPQCLC